MLWDVQCGDGSVKSNAIQFNSIQFMFINVQSEEPDGKLSRRYIVQNIQVEGK